MTESIVKVDGLSHRYNAGWAIRDIHFEIDKNGVLGLLGSNGAGKSTTMNIMCGVLRQTEGKVWINGIDIQLYPEKAKRLIGFLPQTAPLHPDLTVDEYLVHCAWLRKMERRQIRKAVEEAKARCGIAHFSKRLIRNLSGGYRQRVGIAQAIIHRPRLVVMDEPTNGLDPNQITEVRKLIKEIAEERAVIFSSHILSEVQATCKEIRMIESGRMVFSGTMEAFNNYIRPESLLASFSRPLAEAELERVPGVTAVSLLYGNTYRVFFKGQSDVTGEIIRQAVKRDWDLKEICLEKSSLDDVFARLSGKIVIGDGEGKAGDDVERKRDEGGRRGENEWRKREEGRRAKVDGGGSYE